MVYEIENKQKVALVGVGGAGCNFVSEYTGKVDMTTIAINTDKAALHETAADEKIYICKGVVNGQGAMGDAVLGRTCADIHIEEIRQALAGFDKVFVITGLGGGTGTGATPVVIDAAQSQNIMTFAIAITPFSFEGNRVAIAAEGLQKIRNLCPRTSSVDNQKIVSMMSDMTMEEAYSSVNSVIMAHIEACLVNYPESFDFAAPRNNDDEFKGFLKNSPICAFTSA